MDKYILFNTNTQDGLLYSPIVTVFETKEDALLALFGPMEDYYYDDEETKFQDLNDYLSDMVHNYDRDEGTPYKSVFKINTETNIVEIIV